MKTLAEFKRVLAQPETRLTLIKNIDPKTDQERPHLFLNKTRSVKKIQTNGVWLIDPDTKKSAWLDYGKATNWTFTETTATYATDFIILIYRVEKVG